MAGIEFFNKSKKDDGKSNQTERLDDLDKEVKALKEGRITSLETEVDILKDTIVKDTKLEEINQKINSIEENIGNLDLENIKEKIDLILAQRILKKKEELASDFEEKLEEKKNSLQDFIENKAKDYFITYLSERNEEHLKEYKSFNSSNKERIKDLEEKNSRLDKELEEKNRKIERLEEKIKDLESNNSSNETLSQELEKANEKIAKLNSNISSKDYEINDLKDKNKNLKDRKEELTQELNKANNEIDKLKNDVSSNETLSQDLEDANKKINDLNVKIVSKKEKIKELEQERDDFKNKISEEIEKVKRLESDKGFINNKKIEVEKEAKKLENALKEVEEKANTEINRLKDKIENLENSNLNERAEISNKLEDFIEKIEKPYVDLLKAIRQNSKAEALEKYLGFENNKGLSKSMIIFSLINEDALARKIAMFYAERKEVMEDEDFRVVDEVNKIYRAENKSWDILYAEAEGNYLSSLVRDRRSSDIYRTFDKMYSPAYRKDKDGNSPIKGIVDGKK